MEDGYQLAPERLVDGADQWERLEIARLNEGRPRWRVIRVLPLSAYEARSCARYGRDR